MRLISWNVNRAGKRVERQVNALLTLRPVADVIALQEVSVGSVSSYEDLMRGCYPNFIHSLAKISRRGRMIEGKPSGVVIASRFPLEIKDTGYAVETAEHKFLSATVQIDGRRVEIHTAHIPPGCQYERRKIETFKGIYTSLAHQSKIPRILCGDFNTPRDEWVDGTVVTWAQRINENGELSFRPNRGREWDDAERNILKGLGELFDLTDVFRLIHGYDIRQFSWYWKGKVNDMPKLIGRRYDHVFAARTLKPVSCVYLHEFRTSEPKPLSDHSPIEVVFEGI
jgi:exonuclease III